MSTIVVDTDVVSFVFKNHPIALDCLPDLIDRIPIVLFMTVAELDRWSLEACWGAPLLTYNRRDYLGVPWPHADLPRGLNVDRCPQPQWH
jgi:hypothetical protein